MTTLFYPDVSEFQGAIDLSGMPAVCARATEGTSITDPQYAGNKARAASAGAFFCAYHFLDSAPAPAAQAAFCHNVVGDIPLMLDFEPIKNAAGGYVSRPSLVQARDFIKSYRKLGGVCHLLYLPEWYWSELGSPSLAEFAALGMSLVSSNYPSAGYSDTGPGWTPYGGMTPQIWQWTDAHRLHGTTCDFNAFRRDAGTPGTAAEQLKELATTGSRTGSAPVPPPPPPSLPGASPMMLLTGHKAQTIEVFAAGSAKGVTFGCDNTFLHLGDVHLRVAVRSASKGWSEIHTITLPPSGTSAVTFQEADAVMIAVTREGAGTGDEAGVGYSLWS